MTNEVLIIFAKLPRPGRVKTRLGASIGMEEAAAIYDRLAQHTFAVARTQQLVGRGVHLFYDPQASSGEVQQWVAREFFYHPQEGETLGDRMRTAFDLTFKAGASRSVIVGTDAPDLSVELINDAFLMLEHQDVAIGPSRDGGYYLLGMNAPTKNIFEGILWSTGSVFESTVQKVESLGLSHSLLPTLMDVDSEAEYLEYVGRFGDE